MNEKKENNQKHEDEIGLLFIIIFVVCFGIGAGYWVNEKAEISYTSFDIERKEYTPLIFNNSLFLINKKNGKTYILEKDETENYENYYYSFIAKPKTTKTKIIKKKRTAENIKRQLKNASYSETEIEKYLLEKEMEKRELLYTQMKAPNGKIYNVPNDKVEEMKQKGGVIIDSDPLKLGI